MRKLVWLTDLHLVEPGRAWPVGVDPLKRLRNRLADIRTHHSDADRIIFSGDLIQLRHVDAYHLLRAELEATQLPYRLLVGNHDDRAALSKAFPEVEAVDGFIQSAENIGNARLLYLDTVAAGQHHGELCPLRMRWISDQIESSGDEPLLRFMHHPPCDIAVPALDRLKLFGAEEPARSLHDRKGRIQLFCGHVHRNVSGLWAGHPFATLKSPHVQFDLEMTASKLVRFTVLLRPHVPTLTDRYSERRPTAPTPDEVSVDLSAIAVAPQDEEAVP